MPTILDNNDDLATVALDDLIDAWLAACNRTGTPTDVSRVLINAASGQRLSIAGFYRDGNNLIIAAR